MFVTYDFGQHHLYGQQKDLEIFKVYLKLLKI